MYIYIYIYIWISKCSYMASLALRNIWQFRIKHHLNICFMHNWTFNTINSNNSAEAIQTGYQPLRLDLLYHTREDNARTMPGIQQITHPSHGGWLSFGLVRHRRQSGIDDMWTFVGATHRIRSHGTPERRNWLQLVTHVSTNPVNKNHYTGLIPT